jgi:hypothetical protein
MNDAPRPEAFAELRILWVVRVFRLLFGIQVVEVAEELIEAVVGGQKLVLITQMVLPKLPGCITERLEKFRDARVFPTQADVSRLFRLKYVAKKNWWYFFEREKSVQYELLSEPASQTC